MSEPTLAIGTYEEGLAMVGYTTEVRFADVPLELGLVRAFTAMTEDANPSYWHSEAARSLWGEIIVPPGLLTCMFMPMPWRADGVVDRTVLGALVPLPGKTTINVSGEFSFTRPLRIGDWLNVVETVTAVSPQKTTRLGTGHFVTTTATYRDGQGEVVATGVNTLFRFDPIDDSPEGTHS